MEHKEASRKRIIGGSTSANVPKTEKRKPERPKSTYKTVSSFAHLEKSEKASLEAITVTPPAWTKPPKLPRLIVNKLKPWEEQPYKLLSWWDMETFSARAFFQVGSILGILPATVERLNNPKYKRVHGEDEVNEKTKKHVAKWIEQVKKNCNAIALESAATHADRFLWRLQRKMTCSDVLHQIEELRNRIFDDMKGELFFYVPTAYAEYYGVSYPFGSKVSAAFPSASFDIREASTCYALERPTACVFHLMRVLEVALASLGKVFGLSLDHTNWGPAIEQIEKKIREMHQDSLWKVMPDWKDQLEFYAQTISYLGITKEAWRNYTAHARGKFTPEEAKQMFANVKLFMEQISRRLKE